ncbi:hypothetical protein D9M68_634180 [compost metagenome]
MRGARAGARDLLQRASDLRRIGFALGQLGLHAQARQGGLELVRGIGQEAFLRRQRGLQPRQQVVDGRHQGRHFLRDERLFDRAQVVGLARADALLQLVERADATHQRQPDQQHRQRQDDELRHHHALDDFGGQRGSFALGFGHLHQHQPLHAVVAREPGVGHPHLVAAHDVVAQQHPPGFGGFVVARQREIALAADEIAARVQHLVIDQIAVVRAQQVARLGCEVERDPAVVVADHELRERLQVEFEGAVEGLAGNALRDEPGQRQRQRPQQQQRREHPVQDLAEQAALLTLEQAKGHRAAVLSFFFGHVSRNVSKQTCAARGVRTQSTVEPALPGHRCCPPGGVTG